VIEFVESATRKGDGDIPPEERVAVFDNDGTLWCEKPMPIELGFILQRLAAMADEDPALRLRQPWKAAHDEDYAWLGDVVVKHYAGDDREVKTLLGGVVRAFAGWSVEDYATAADAFMRNGRHPTLGRSFFECGYRPMVELLRYLEAGGFANYIASGGSRDFMRGFAQGIYGIPPERVIGSSNELRYRGNGHGSVVYQAEPDVFDDGPAKPVRIWSRIGRRPILAVGNSNGDLPMLQFAGGPSRPALRLLVLPDDGRARIRLHRQRRGRADEGPGGGLDGDQHEERLGLRVRRRAVSASSTTGRDPRAVTTTRWPGLTASRGRPEARRRRTRARTRRERAAAWANREVRQGRGGRRSELSSRFEELDGIPICVLDLDLATARACFHLVAKANPGLLQFSDETRKIRDLQHHPVPAARLLLLPIRHRPRA
jgi:phosphoserine phosphatase